jgi:hypothetical protein
MNCFLTNVTSGKTERKIEGARRREGRSRSYWKTMRKSEVIEND